MTKRLDGYTCDSIGSDLGLCEDFDPSYAPALLKRKARKLAKRKLLAAVEEVTGIPAGKVTLSMPLQTLLEDEAELVAILRLTGQESRAVANNRLLFERGKLSSLLPALVLSEAYKAHVEMCAGLVEDEPAFRAAGCKRRGHVMVPKGRLSLVDREVTRLREGAGSPYPEFAENFPFREHSVTGRKRVRWKDHEPPLDSRTQSEASLGAAQRRKSSKRGEAASRIKMALGRYVKETAQQQLPAVFIPLLPGPLVTAGMPKAAALWLVQRLGGTRVLQARLFSSPSAALGRVFGGAALDSNGDASWFYYPDYYDLRQIAGPVRSLAPLLKHLARGAYRGRHPGGREFTLPIRAAALTLQGKRVRLPVDVNDFAGQLDRAVSDKTAWSLHLDVGDARGEGSVDLQHSILSRERGSSQRRDYTTLRGFTLWELPDLLATQLSPKRTKRGSRLRPFAPTQKNPSSGETTMGKKNSSWPLDALSDIDSYYFSDDVFPPERSIPVNRRNPRKKKKAAAKKARKPAARKARKVTMPAARKAQLSRVMKKAHAIIREQGCDMGKAMRAAWKSEGKKNPRVKWPRYDRYQQVAGAYAPTIEYPPVNRRNPKRKKAASKRKGSSKGPRRNARTGRFVKRR